MWQTSIDVIWPGEFTQRHWIAPIGDDFTVEELVQFNPSFMAAATVDGKVYGDPVYVDGARSSIALICWNNMT